MATEKQIEANRLNAQKSTGPSSVEGKAASRLNALKTGIDAEMINISREHPDDLGALAQRFHDQYQPITPTECSLVDSLSMAEWMLRRFRKLEAQLYEVECVRDFANDGGGNNCDAFVNKLEAFTRLYRRQENAQRTFHRALLELERVQANRPPLPPSAPPDPPEIGFVPETSPPTATVDPSPPAPDPTPGSPSPAVPEMDNK